MKPSVVICCILLALASLPARAAPPVYRELRDWVVACDNTRRCEAVGFPGPHGLPLVMRLTREAGPKGELSMRLTGSEPFQLDELRLDGRPLKLDAKGWQRQSEEVDFIEWTSRHDAAASQLLGAVRNGTALTAGKYVADGVYVGAQQGLTPGSSKAVVEIEVLPRVTVQGDVSQNGGTGIGLNYKYDY